MNGFGQELVKVRIELGYKTTKSFFNYLKLKGLDCNYQYFVKIEKNISFPSSLIVNQIAKGLERKHAELIITTFCKEQFNSFSYMFENASENLNHQNSKSVETKNKYLISQGQMELNIYQVKTLGIRKENYFLFLILTLSRNPIKLSELKMLPNFKKSFLDLKNASLVSIENDFVYATSSEFVFPKAESSKLENTYLIFDDWDKEFSSYFNFKKHLNKMMIRRISPRYFPVILKQLDAFIDFVRCSDETDHKYNKEVLHLHILISKGDLPG